MQEAVRHHLAFRHLLDEELGVPPSALFARQLQSGTARFRPLLAKLPRGDE
ncbi:MULTISPECIES: hypothetical protein [unclassified Streptomyces]|uniref:hypothetical protein n=1 Tax=unclassified Streptomyces TaxID=2593676 RepID=UPI002B1E6685|nr:MULTISPECIES: hypothetical protein [unclassified Streptomyces]